jgi:outer membrane biosynthesis protein TonB
MPQTPTPTDPGQPTPEPQQPELAPQQPADPHAPLSFVPHGSQDQPLRPIARIRTNRFGELDEHELVKLLDTIEDERARGRFRESIYISVFFWLAIAWLVFYGPRVLWHAPQLINPADVLKNREVTELNMPVLRQAPRLAPKPAPKLDNQTIKRLQEMTRSAPAPAPAPAAATPTPPPPTPTPSAAAPPLPAAPTPLPRNPAPSVPDAPAPQPNSHPNFNAGPSTPGESIQSALNKAARSRSGNGNGTAFSGSPSNPLGGGVEILSDPGGIDWDPYIKRIIADIKRNWLPLIPAEAEPPISKQGETYIRFIILPDGNLAINGMHLDGSTHDVAIDKSCWNAIVAEGQFPPLPSQFHGPNLELRIHFLVNKDIGR